jgi:hypothetical protein
MMSTLTEVQRSHVAAWLADGLKLSDIQKRLESEFGLRLTYMEVKFLIGDLQLMPKDQEPAKPAEAGVLAGGPGGPKAPPPTAGPAPKGASPQPGDAAPGTIAVAVDQITRPGAMVSGKVTFSDGQKGTWYVDQMGRLGLAPGQKGYRPSAADMREFQLALDQELARLGL